MISFRYHIVSITAVFLALALGVTVGSAVHPTTALTRERITRMSSDLNNARAEIAGLRAQVSGETAIVKNLSTRVTRDALLGRQVVFVDDGAEGAWEGGVRRAMSDATATDLGAMTITDRFASPDAPNELSTIAATAGVAVDPNNVAGSVMTAAGERFGTPQGSALIDALAKAGYVRTAPKAPAPWPPHGAVVVFFTTDASDAPQAVALATFAAAAAKPTAVTVVGSSPEQAGAVGALRLRRGLPTRLSTFDSGSIDSTGVGSVLALLAAIGSHGGHFGAAPGLSYLPRA